MGRRRRLFRLIWPAQPAPTIQQRPAARLSTAAIRLVELKGRLVAATRITGVRRRGPALSRSTDAVLRLRSGGTNSASMRVAFGDGAVRLGSRGAPDHNLVCLTCRRRDAGAGFQWTDQELVSSHWPSATRSQRSKVGQEPEGRRRWHRARHRSALGLVQRWPAVATLDEQQGLFFVGYFQERYGGMVDPEVGEEPGIDTTSDDTNEQE